MEPRFYFSHANREAYHAMVGLEVFVNKSALDARLLEIVKIRASQINGCAFCLDMHTEKAEQLGETSQRLHLVATWRDAPVFSEAERAALELAEALTEISKQGVSRELYDRVRAHFDEKALVALITAINTINAWNRLVIASGTQPQIRQDAAAQG
jgi:AhpD family alkylhydroperoxidase